MDEHDNITCPCCGYPVGMTASTCAACGEPQLSIYRPPATPESPPAGDFRARNHTIIAVIVLAAMSLAYRIMVWKNLEQTALLFIGLPAVLAVTLACIPSTKSITVTILKALVIGLCLSCLVLGEGAICVLMAAAPAMLVGLLVGVCMDMARMSRAERESRSGKLRALLPVPLLAVMSLEGTAPALSFPRGEIITARRTVPASAEAVQSALARRPDFAKPLPFLLRFGFPKPVHTSGGGIMPGDECVIHFAGGEGKPGTLTLRVAESRPGMVRFESAGDTSHIAHWLRWKSSTVTWTETAPGACDVQWSIAYDRLLDPAWYFGPAERAAVAQAAGYLIETLATP